jgi:hypothetical protein
MGKFWKGPYFDAHPQAVGPNRAGVVVGTFAKSRGMYYHWGGGKEMGFFSALSECAAGPIATSGLGGIGLGKSIGGDFYPQIGGTSLPFF